MIFEDPPKLARQDNAGVWYHSTWEWTADINKNGAHVPGSGSPGKLYVYIDRVMLHEFGHTLGLHDFYADNNTGLKGLDAVMNKSFEIEDEDIAQLKAIYLLHSSH